MAPRKGSKSGKPKPKAAPASPDASATGSRSRLSSVRFLGLAMFVACGLGTLGLRWLRLSRTAAEAPLEAHTPRSENIGRRRQHVTCNSTSTCGERQCDRVVVDDFISETDIERLISIAERGMDAADADAAAGGPTIFDINSGYVMAPGARLENLYHKQQQAEPPRPYFTPDDYELYRSVIRRLKAEVEATFSRDSDLYFTAPTFITRLSGENPNWRPTEPHDEYYHMHVDRDNTAHYEYSGLLYLTDYGVDFDGGLFAFADGVSVEPRKGRLSMFGSGPENEHHVQPVTRGRRLTLSFWFACDEDYHFHDFLDGKVHNRFREPGTPDAAL